MELSPEKTETAFLVPLLLSLLAGSGTAIGGLLVVAGPCSQPSEKLIATTLAFAAGVMLSVSGLDLWWPQAQSSFFFATAWLCLGILISRIVQLIPVPEPEALWLSAMPERLLLAGTEPGGAAAQQAPRVHSSAARRVSAWRLGFLLSVVLTAHNLPEGVLVSIGAVKDRELGLALCIAILIHNIAEGCVVAIPVLAGTGSRVLALTLTIFSGLSEPFGAALGLLALRNWLRASEVEGAINACLCAVGGVMIGVSIFELLPQAWSFSLAPAGYTGNKPATARQLGLAVIAGAAVMMVTMHLF